MTIILLLLSPALFAIIWIIRFQICSARLRYLIDTYGLDRKKLRKLSCYQTKKLRNDIEGLRDKNDAFGLENLIRPYRP
jgi:hypothetical protein